MVTHASAEAEPHLIWTRPLEVGFEMGDTPVLEPQHMFVWLSSVDGDAVYTHYSADDGRTTNFGWRNGSTKAAQSNNADGMYILFVEESVTWSGLVKETTTVLCRVLKLKISVQLIKSEPHVFDLKLFRKSTGTKGDRDDGN